MKGYFAGTNGALLRGTRKHFCRSSSRQAKQRNYL